MLYCYCFYGYCSHTMNSYFSTFLCTGVLYTMMIKKKRITAALLALGLGAVTMFSQFPDLLLKKQPRIQMPPHRQQIRLW